MSAFRELLKKDLLIEVRTKETLSVHLFLALVIAVVAALGVNSAFIEGEAVARLYPALVWIGFLFASTAAAGRSFEPELEHMAIDGLLLSGISPVWIFVSKWISAAAVMLLGQALNAAVLAVLLDMPLGRIAGGVAVVSVLVVAGYAALATLLTALASTSRLKGVLLPVVLLPLVFPLFFGAIELSMSVVLDGSVPFESAWFSLLLGLDVVYVVLGFNLFEYVVRE